MVYFARISTVCQGLCVIIIFTLFYMLPCGFQKEHVKKRMESQNFDSNGGTGNFFEFDYCYIYKII